MRVLIWTDGAAMKRLNPGPAGAGYVIMGEGGLRLEGSEPLGYATNNEAEYEVRIRALTLAADNGATSARVHSDSKVVVDHVNGVSKCRKSHLKLLLDCVVKQRNRFG